jgi:hypothetical protein
MHSFWPNMMFYTPEPRVKRGQIGPLPQLSPYLIQQHDANVMCVGVKILCTSSIDADMIMNFNFYDVMYHALYVWESGGHDPVCRKLCLIIQSFREFLSNKSCKNS